jgi:5'-nucleotidase
VLDIVRRTSPEVDAGPVTYEEAFTVQPFGNGLVTLTLTGAQIERTLDQQWQSPTVTKILQPSHGFTYAFDPSTSTRSRRTSGPTPRSRRAPGSHLARALTA